MVEFQIQLKIADKYYPMICKRSEEEIIRKAASNVNNKLLKYSSAYSNAKFEIKDLLAMVAFHYSKDNLLVQKNEDMSPLFDKIKQLNKELEDYLSMN
ncbi:MAG: cell division protein ZapA [Dysgonamonadaceae bacterium]|jgi:cell division protein ZapA|nr:cell division protein ZapA [Dysgonamonadaceae bacterium]